MSSPSGTSPSARVSQQPAMICACALAEEADQIQKLRDEGVVY